MEFHLYEERGGGEFGCVDSRDLGCESGALGKGQGADVVDLVEGHLRDFLFLLWWWWVGRESVV